MIYFCADDYGISKSSNTRIEECFKNGVLNKISVLPNGDLSDFNERLLGENIKLSLHLNLVEGCPLSKKEDVSLLVSEKGFFKYSFIGLFFLSLFGNRRLLEKQLYNEIKAQNEDTILFFRVGDFYEMFFEDAKKASEELDLVLTGKECGLEERAPMCGVPFHSCEAYIARLVEKGYNPINQIVGYILSEDPTYITTHNNARSLIRRLDRDELLQDLVKEYLKVSKK